MQRLALLFVALAATFLSSPSWTMDASSFKSVWTSKTGEWSHGVVVAPWGDVISVTGSILNVHARDTGNIIDRLKICSALNNGVSFKDRDTAIVVCPNEIDEVSFKQGQVKKVVSLTGEAVSAATTKDFVAVADKNNQVQIFNAKTWQSVKTLNAPGKTDGMALSHDGQKLALGIDGGKALLVDIASGKAESIMEGGGRMQALAFSPDDTRVFLPSKYFEVTVVDLKTRAILKKYRTGSWLISAQFLDAETIAAAGSDGFALYATSEDPVSLGGSSDAAEAFGASEDSAMLCSGNRAGDIACFSKTALKPSEYVKPIQVISAQTSSASPTTPPLVPLSNEAAITGEIVGRSDSSLTIKVSPSSKVTVGAKGTLSKYFETDVVGFKTSGWLEIATVSVTGAENGSVHLRLEEEKSIITLNGKKTDHFKQGTKVKLVY